MADVLPSCIGMEGLLYLIFSGFVQANKSHTLRSFQLVRINPSGGGKMMIPRWMPYPSAFQLVRINPSGGGQRYRPILVGREPFQLVRINPSGGVAMLILIIPRLRNLSN